MEKSHQIYVKLQRHLNRQAVGFPATRSGAEIRILKYIFTPEEARIATFLSHKPETLDAIFERVKHLVPSPEDLKNVLEGIQRKGGIESKSKDGTDYYCNAPFVVGMYELQLGRLTQEFLQDFDEYINSHRFGLAFLSTKLPQMRTIPISKSIRLEPQTSTYDEINTLLQQAEPPFVVMKCICREKAAMQGHPCRVTVRKETCLAMGSVAQTVLKTGLGRQIDRSEALAIIDKNQEQGLVLQPSNTRKADFVCSCCGCCCSLLGLHQSLPRPLDFWHSNYYAVIDTDTCSSCGECTLRCQVGAVTLPIEGEPAYVDHNLCIGCGICVSICPTQAVSLSKRSTHLKPPSDREELYDIIMAGKKSGPGKLKLWFDIFFDAIRTRRMQIFK